MNIQKTINYLALFLPTVGVTLSACKNEIVDQTIENTNPIPAVLTQQDKDFTRLAKVVSKALYEDVTLIMTSYYQNSSIGKSLLIKREQ